jgi:hypothetical protein
VFGEYDVGSGYGIGSGEVRADVGAR